MELKELTRRLEKVEDPRRTSHGHILHKLVDILVIALCCLICNGTDFEDMEDFGKEREEWLKTFLELPNGIPSSDTFRRVFERIDPDALAECLYDWLANNRKEGSVIAIDGKTICGSANHKHRAYHVVSAFVAENQITLGEIATDEKSNEITAVPELLRTINVENSIVTADAMSCQKEIVRTIREEKADYVIALKGNQHALFEDTQLYFQHFAQELPKHETLEKGHGRIEKREYRLLTQLDWLDGRESWAGLNGLGIATSTVTTGEETTTYTRYFITSLTELERFAYAVRKHWAIENELHWCLDVIFDEDDSRARKDNSPLNLNVLRKIALSLCKNCKDKRVAKSSIQKRRNRAALNPDVLSAILLG
jgi:predicted transposase YbfD/YdcC